MSGQFAGPAGLVFRVLNRFRNRPDSEVEQALIRVVIGLIALTYFFTIGTRHEDAGVAIGAVNYAILFSVCAALLLAWIGISPGVSTARRSVGMLMDMGSITYLMYTYGELMTPLYPIYLWVAVGNGLRYGNRYLIASAVMALAGMVFVIHTNPFWLAHPVIGWSLVLGLVLVPPYVAILGHRLVKALQQANDANEAKSRFLANVSHEIFNPMQAIIGFIELIRASELNDEVRHYINTLQASATSMISILKDLLDISKIEAGKIEISNIDFDLYQTVNSVAAMLAPQAAKKGLLFTVHVDPACPYLLHGDPDRLRQILINFCINAIKFTEAGHCDVYVLNGKDDESGTANIVFKVSDTGIGIPEEMQAHVFETFTQADATITRRFGGTGLGLAIAKNLVEIQGGTLTVDSRPGEGTVFRFEIPYALQQAEVQPEDLTGRVCLITFDTLLDRELANWTKQWGLSLTIMKRRPTGDDDNYQFDTIMVDERCLIDPLAFPRKIAELSAKDSIHRSVMLLRRLGSNKEALLEAGYSVILDLPLDKRLTFNALHSTTIEWGSDESVIPLSSAAQTRALDSYRILVAEDTVVNQDVIGATLSRAGHRVDIVDSGDAALERLEDNDYDLLLLDFNMPDVSGMDVMQQWQAMSTAPDMTKVLFLTADISPSVERECLNAGAEKVLHKPIRPSKLLAEIAEAMTSTSVPASKASTDRTSLVIDVEELSTLGVMMGDDMLVHTIERFLADSEQKLGALWLAVMDSNQDEIFQLSHAFKGNAATLYATELSDLLSTINHDAFQNKSYEEYQVAFSRLRSSLEKTRRAFREYLDSPRDGQRRELR